MILVVILAILAVTLLFMCFISEHTMVLGRGFLILPVVFGIISLTTAFLSFRLDTTNKTESVILKTQPMRKWKLFQRIIKNYLI